MRRDWKSCGISDTKSSSCPSVPMDPEAAAAQSKRSSENRVALVTGAATGLGLEIAKHLAALGYDLALVDVNDEMLAANVAAPAFAGRQVASLHADLSRHEDITACAEAAAAKFPHVHLLVNNAARTLRKPAVEVEPAEWDAVLAVNLKAAFFLSTALARRWLAHGQGGAIVNIASTHGLTGLAERSVYGIAKGGMIQMTRMLAIEWAEHNIRVNAVAPATVMTPSRMAMLADPAQRDFMLARIPMRRFPLAEEIAAAVAYLGGPEAASVTGQVLAVDGGLTAA
jgi:NAD(P)-dependent dehydrogenase (short-subunit alcohol dehydrogenase family)